MSSDKITIIVRLPAPLDAVSEVLRVIGDRWPEAMIDTNHPDGWHIELAALPTEVMPGPGEITVDLLES